MTSRITSTSQGPAPPPGRPTRNRRVAELPQYEGDWVYAQAQYEQGIKTLDQIGKEIGVTASAVIHQANRYQWIRDPYARMKLDAEIKASRKEAEDEELSNQRELAIRVNSEMQARVLVEHRTDIKEARDLVQAMFKELIEVQDNLPDLEELGELLRRPDDKGHDKLNDLYKKIISFGGRSDSVKKLTEAMKTLILLQRQTFGIAGALMDPEDERPVQGISVDGMKVILDKFQQVLEPKTKVVEIVEEVLKG